MVTYLYKPKNKLTLGATSYEDTLVSARVQRVENGFDSAVISMPDPTIYPDTVTAGTTVQLEVKESGGSYTTIFKGIVRFPIVKYTAQQKALFLHCDGAGYGLSEMIVANEYGSQSINKTYSTLQTILTGVDEGLIPKYVNNALKLFASSYSYTATSSTIEDITGTIPYIEFPYKPADKCLNDLADLITAMKAGGAGAHWIVDTADTLRFKLLTTSQVGWTKYYGDSQANATLAYGPDYIDMDFEKLTQEANYIVYYGLWRRPSNGDAWTENNSGLWGTGYSSTLSDENTLTKVNSYSLKATTAGAANPIGAHYPSGKDAAWNFEAFNTFNIPHLNFYIYRHDTTGPSIFLKTTDSDYYYMLLSTAVPSADTWYHLSFPIGPDYKIADNSINWLETGTGDWSDITNILFLTTDSSAGGYFLIDGLNFSGCPVCRVAYNSSSTPTRMRLITDDVGKDDSLEATDDSGLMAQFAYAELLRLQTTPVVGNVTIGMVKDALPGQLWYVQDVDMRATKIVHTIDPSPVGYRTQLFLTDDVLNGRARLRYEEQNKVWESIRPEWQDRQASNMKAGAVDWRITRLAKDYAPAP
jgi:hypothetical protein